MALFDPGEFPTEVPTPRETVEVPSLDFSVADVLAWARTKPADEGYDYDDPGNCALCQFLKQTGRTRQDEEIGERYWSDLGGEVRNIPADANAAANNDGIANTFGGLVKRLEGLQK